MSEHAGPNHDTDCLALHLAKAYCGCSRAAWLGEMVPRAQARIELLTQLERWARERETFETADLDRVSRTAPAVVDEAPPWRAAWAEGPFVREYLRMGAGLAESIVRQTWQRMAVRALHMRTECTARLAELEKRNVATPTEVAHRTSQSELPFDDVPGVVTLQPAGERL